MKALLKKIIELTPYRIVRRAQNRFEAFDYSLRLLGEFGFTPTLIIDGGAHLGSFADIASAIFPSAVIHMVEPQPACQAALRAKADGVRFVFHPYALGDAEDVAKGLTMAASSEASTGAYISTQGVPVQAAELDALVRAGPADRALIKLDLQGFELHALRGAAALLDVTEVVLTEVSFFAQAYEPSILELVSFLDSRGFVLFDIAALSGRTRDNRLRQGDFIFVRRDSSLAADTAWA